MSVLTNANWETFVQGVAKGMPQGEAYRAAGYKAAGKAADVNASRLLKRPEIAARLSEIQHKAAAKTELTLERLIHMGLDLLKAAQDAEDFSAASSTYERVAKISGHWIDRSESKSHNTTRMISDRPVSEDEWLSMHAPGTEARPN